MNFKAIVFGDGYVPANGSSERAVAYGLSVELSDGMMANDIENAMIQVLLHQANVVEAANFAEPLLKKNIAMPSFKGGL